SGVDAGYAAEPEPISLRHWGQGEWFDGDNLFITSGADDLLGGLASGLNVHLKFVVRRVEYDSEGVRVTSADGMTLTAEKAVMTLPLGVLQENSVGFVPALPDTKRAA